jgi:YidC/Oxa1 family membrane protein insertase
MTDIRRSLLWVVFGLSLVMLWDRWQVHNGNPALFFPQAAPAVAASAQPGLDGSVPVVTGGVAAVPVGAEANAPSQRHEFTTDLFRLTLDSEGGSVVGAVLLKQAEETGGQHANAAPLVLLQKDAQRTYVAQSGLAETGLPNHKTAMQLISQQTALAEGQDRLEIKFASEPLNGVQLLKTYTLHRGSYVVDVRQEVINQGTAAVPAHVYFQFVRDDKTAESATPFYQTFTGPAIYSNEKKFQKVSFEEITKGNADFVSKAPEGYVAMVQHYFASAWLLADGVLRENFVRETQSTPAKLFAVGSIVDLGMVEPGQSKVVDARLFMGPQDEKALEAVAPGLELVKDYGWVTILAKPLYWLLEKIHVVAQNWGWSIVLLVVLIKAAFYWLNAAAYRSMAKMKALNPRITEMRARLKDNPQQMQQEMMRIYREEKVNPLGGCLPIMVQIPVFIALYWVLLSSVEMRNAPWAMWIHDLSTKDPLYILPVVMTLTTLFQTALNPLPPDPLQAKLMWIMPLAFSVMFFQFPAGLVLYWITNNTLTIIQQWHINHRMGIQLKFNIPKFW